MFDTLHDPVQMFFGLELPIGFAAWAAFFSHDRGCRKAPSGTSPSVHDFEVFLGDVKNASPYFFTGRGNDAGQPASPLGGPPAKLDRIGDLCSGAQLGRIQIGVS